MTKKIVRPVQSKDIAIGERIKVENLSKPIICSVNLKLRSALAIDAPIIPTPIINTFLNKKLSLMMRDFLELVF